MSDNTAARSVGRGAAGFLLAGAYVLAAGTALAPPTALVGARLNVAATSGLIIAGLVAAGWVGVDAARGRLELRRLATFVVTGWLLLLALGAIGRWLVGTVIDTGPPGLYLAQVVVLLVATVSAGWMAYSGGWERARHRMGSGGLDRM
ncbi:MAG: hypothetical protein V5A56_11165 [Halolamina sp.]